MSFYKERQIAEDLAQACRVLGAYDMTFAALGHVSYRIEGTDTMLIKAKGPNEVGLRYTATRDIVKVDFNADMVDGPDDLQPPSESFLHIWIYKNRPEVKSVVHVHPEHAVLLSMTGKEFVNAYSSFHPPSAGLIRNGIPVYQSSRTIATPEQGQELADVMGDKDVALLVGHGIATAGTSIEQSTMNALHLELASRMMYKAHLIGTPRALPESDLRRPPSAGDAPKTRGSVGGIEGMMATWRYYVAVTEERLGRRNDKDDD